MNILFLYGNAIVSRKGGVQRVTEVLANEFARRGNGVFYLALPGDIGAGGSWRIYSCCKESFLYQNFFRDESYQAIF